MNWWIFWAIYVVTFVGSYRSMYKVYRGLGTEKSPTWSKEGAAAMAACTAILGPLILPGIIGYKLLTPMSERDRRERREKLDKELYELETADVEGKAFDRWLDRRVGDFAREYGRSTYDSSGQPVLDKFKAELMARVREAGLE